MKKVFFMNNSYLNEKDINLNDQMYLLKSLCTEYSVSFDDLNTMLEAEKIKKLHRRNHYISQVISDIIEG